MIMKILPAFIGLISFGLPGALVLYFVTSNLFRVGQQWLITRTIYSDEAVAAGVIDVEADEKPKAKKSDGADSGKAVTGGTKGRPTPSRGGPSANGKPKGNSKRTSGRGGSASSLPQPRPRKKKR
jgi:YidC/Oxa1 family membrane protein insertase